MANFKLNCQLQINGPANMRAITQQIQRQLSSINANVNFKINPSATRNVNNLNVAAAKLSSTLQNLTRNANQAVPAINNLASALASNAGNIKSVAQSTQGLQKNLQAVQKTTQQVTNSMESLGKQAANAIKRYAAFSIAAGGIYELAAAIKSGFKEALDFQNEMVKLSQVTGSSVKSLSGLSDEVTRLSTTLGISSKTLLNASQTLAQAGFTAKEVKVGLEALAKTELAPTFKNIENTTEGAIAAMKQFDIEIKDLEGTLGSINSVSAQFAVESDDLVTAIRRSGSAFKAAGGNLEEFIALFTSVRQTTRESAETIATGFRTIFTRIQRPATLNYFKSLGVELTDAKGNFIGAYEAVRRLSSALQGIESTDPRFAKIVEELGGFRQVSKVIPLLQQFAVSEKALGVAIRGRASLSKDAETAQESLLRQLVKVKEEFSELFRTVINDSSFRSLVDITVSATKSFIDLAKAATPLIPILTSIFAIKAGSGLGSFAKGFTGAFGTKKFARGGVVPGQGNGDTVPAMLTPGEFVIRKDAAQTIGYDKLHKVNKYAAGGIVKKGSLLNASDNERTFGAIALEPGNVSPGTKTVSISLAQLFKKDEIKKYKFTPSQLNAREPINIVADSVYKKAGSSSALFKNFKKGLANQINKIGEQLGQQLGVSERTPINQESIPNYDAIVGGVFEGAVASIGNPYDSKGESGEFDNKKTFDFAQGINFNEAMKNLPVDAKKKLSEDAIKSVKNKAANLYRARGLVKPELFKETISSNQGVGKDKLGASKFIEDLKNGKAGKPGLYFSGADYTAQAVKAAKDANLDAIISKTGSRLRKANGGSIPGQGTDTVPALLTPGEFVVNKKSAQAIGYGNLNKMNQVQKFANGGVVRFANGGKAPVNTGGDGFAKFYALGTILPGIVTQFASLGEEARRFSGVLGGAIGIYAVLSPQLKQFSTNITEMSAKVQSSSKALEAKKQKDIQTLTDKKNSEIGQIQSVNLSRINKARDDVKNGIISRTDGAYAIRTIRKQQSQQLSGIDSRFNVGLSDIDSDYSNRLAARTARKQGRFNRYATSQKIGQAGTAFGIGGAIAGLAGGAIRDSSAQDIRNNQGGFKFGSTVSGAGNGAAIGASVGALAGPVGIAVGAVGGALIGGITSFISSAEEAKKMIEQLDFNESFDSLEKSLNDVASGKVTLSSQSSNISSQLDKTRANFFSTNPELRKEAVNRTASQASNFESILSKFTSTAKSIDDVKKASGGLGSKLIAVLSELNNVSASQLEDTIKKQIEANTKQVSLQQKMSEAIASSDNSFLRLKQSTDGIVESFRSASESVDHLGAAFDSAFSRIGSSTISSSNVKLESAGLRDFGNTRDTTRLASALQPLLKPLGKQGAEFGVEVTNISQGIKQLPNILQSLSGSAGFLDPERFTDTLGRELDKFGETFKNVVVGNTAGMVGGDQGESELFNKLKTDPKALAEELTRQLEFLPKALEEANKMLEDNLNNYAKRSSQISELELNIREENVKNIQLAFEKSSRLTELRGGQVTSQDVIQNIDAQRNAKTGGEKATTAGLAALQSQIYENEQKILKGDKDLIPVTENLKVRLASLTSVVKDTATNFDKVNAIVSYIKKEQGLRSFKKNTIDDFVYGDTESRSRTIQSVAATNAVANGADLESLHPEIRQSIKSFVDSLPDDFKFNVLGGKTKKEFQDEQRTKSLKAAGVSDQEIKAINEATPQEDKLYAELDKAFKQMESAQKTFENFIGGQKDVLSAALADSNKIFENNLKTMLLSEQKKAQEDIQAKAEAESAAAQNKLNAIGQLPAGNNEESQIQKAKRYVSGKDEYLSIKRDEEKAKKLNDILSGNIAVTGNFQNSEINNVSDFRKQLMNPENVSKALGLGISFDKYSAAASTATQYDAKTKEFKSGSEAYNDLIKQLIGSAGTELSSQTDNRKNEFASKYGSDFTSYNLEEVKKQEEALKQIGDSTVETLASTFTRINETLKRATASIAEIDSQLQKPAQTKARGGIVYANRGMFVPKGTDTVPAMLTPGEFVVNAKSAKQHRGLLEQINTQYKANGGTIYAAAGRFIPSYTRTSRLSEVEIPHKLSERDIKLGKKLTQQQQRENLIARRKDELVRQQQRRLDQSNLPPVFRGSDNRGPIGGPSINGVPFGAALKQAQDAKKSEAKINGVSIADFQSQQKRQKEKDYSDVFGENKAIKFALRGQDPSIDIPQNYSDTPDNRLRAGIQAIKKENQGNISDRQKKLYQQAYNAEVLRASKAGEKPKSISDFVKDSENQAYQEKVSIYNSAVAEKDRRLAEEQAKLEARKLSTQNYLTGKQSSIGENPSYKNYDSSKPLIDYSKRDNAADRNIATQRPFKEQDYTTDMRVRMGAAQADLDEAKRKANIPRFANGGSVDTVPAMLTPGEFVLNKNTVNRVGTNNLQRFNKGGPVNYLAGGGPASSSTMPAMDTGALTAAINIFNTSATALANALKSIPASISLEANIKPVEVIINGAEVLSQLQQPLQDLISSKINEGVNNLLKDKFPGAGLANNVV